MHSSKHAMCIAAFTALLSAPVHSMYAQATGAVAVIGGGTTDARGVQSNTVTVAPVALMAFGDGSSTRIGASGSWFQNNAWSAGLNAGVVLRVPIGSGFALTTNADGAATATSYNATFVTGNAVPALEYSWRGLTVFGGARAAVGTTSVPDQQNGFLGFPGVPSLKSVTRSSVAPAYGAQWRLGMNPRSAVFLWAREDPMRVDGVAIGNHSAGVMVVVSAVTISGAAGMRRAPDENINFASGSVSLALSPIFSLDVAAGTYPSDRLTGASRGRYLSAGFNARIGGSREHPLPVPSDVGAPAPGETRLSIRAPSASRVELLGDWNDWQPVTAQRAANGVWYADVRLAPGDYRYAFRVDGSEWRVPAGTAAVDDGFGGKSAYVTVRDTGAAK